MLRKLGGVLFLRLLGSLLAFLSVIFITRSLGAEQSGLYFIVISFITFISGVCGIGAGDHIIKVSSSKYEEQTPQFINSFTYTLFAVIFVSFCISLLIYLFANQIALYFNKDNLSSLIQLSAFILPVLSVSALLTPLLLGLGRSSLSIFFTNVFIPALIIIITTLAYFYTEIINGKLMLYIFMITVIANLCLLAITIFKYIQVKVKFFSGFRSFVYPKECIDFWIINIVNIALSSGLILLGIQYCEAKEVAIISVSGRLCLIVSILISSVNVYCAPYFSKLYSDGNMKELMFLVKKLTRLLSLFFFIFVAFITITGEYLLSIFGGEFTGGYWFLIILIIGPLMTLLVGPCHYLLLMTNNEKTIRNLNILNLAFSIPLTLILSFYFGAYGLVSSIAISGAGQCIALFCLVKTRLGFYTQSKTINLGITI